MLIAAMARADEKKSSTEKTETAPADSSHSKPAAVSVIAAHEIKEFDQYSTVLQHAVEKAAALTTQNLTYTFGSSDPKNGGMDCSGTMYHLLQSCGFKDVPRQSDEMCRWIMRRSVLYRTENVTRLTDSAFSALRPGDLLFWSGTYESAASRRLPVTHVMIYLGKRKSDGKPVIFGASDGRSYEGQRRCGVSVFDFALPKSGDKSAFYGYGPLPGDP
jgi:cell wall-associated NlpC family hydrolase